MGRPEFPPVAATRLCQGDLDRRSGLTITIWKPTADSDRIHLAHASHLKIEVTHMLTETLVSRLKKLTTPLVADALSRLGLPEVFVGPDIRPIVPFAQIVGTSVTLRIRARTRDETPDMPHYRQAMSSGLRQVSPVLMIEVAPELRGRGVFGSGAATFARSQSFAGAIVDGATRDSHDLQRMNFPVYSRGLSPLYLVPHGRSEFFNEPIRIGMAEVSPGDVVFADHDGVLMLNPGTLEDVVTRAEQIGRWEDRVIGAFAQGKMFEEALAEGGAMP